MALGPTTAMAFSNESLRLIILPTEKCNFRCVYCYEDFAVGKMLSSVSDSVIAFLQLRIPSISELHISWFGGEPLLAIDVIQKIMSAAHVECDKSGISLTSGITTNGHFIDQRVFDILSDLQVLFYQITLDGSRSYHNKRRIMQGGRGSFDTIVSNIRNMCKSEVDFKASLRIHVDRNNQYEMEELFGDISEIVSDRRITVSFERVKYLGKPIGGDISVMSLSEFEEFLNEIVVRIPGLSENIDNVLDKIDTHVCYASLPNNFVIRSSGEIQKCTVALNNQKNTVGKLEDDGRLSINDNYLQWVSVWADNDASLVSCPARKVLFGAK